MEFGGRITQKQYGKGFKSSSVSHWTSTVLIIPSSLPTIAFKNLQSSWTELERAFLKTNLDFLCYELGCSSGCHEEWLITVPCIVTINHCHQVLCPSPTSPFIIETNDAKQPFSSLAKLTHSSCISFWITPAPLLSPWDTLQIVSLFFVLKGVP